MGWELFPPALTLGFIHRAAGALVTSVALGVLCLTLTVTLFAASSLVQFNHDL